MQTQVKPCLSIIGHYDRIHTKVDFVSKKRNLSVRLTLLRIWTSKIWANNSDPDETSY